MYKRQTKFTGRLLKAAISKYAAHRRNVKLDKQRRRETPVVHRGRQTVKQLTNQNQGVSSIDFQDRDIRRFERIARKYGVDYACLLYTSCSWWKTARK